MDDIEAEDIEEETVNNSTSPARKLFQNCTQPAKFKPKQITCEASSVFNRNFGCKKAFDGKLAIGKAKSAWASKGEGVGAWIKASFNQAYAVTQLKLLQRHFPGESNKKVEILFSPGIKQAREGFKNYLCTFCRKFYKG